MFRPTEALPRMAVSSQTRQVVRTSSNQTTRDYQ